MATGGGRELKSTGYEVFILLLSLLSVANMLFVVIVNATGSTDGPARDVVLAMDLIITPIFVIDFFYRLLTARSKSGYLIGGWGWADFLATMPMFRIFRVFRIIRVIRLLTTYGPRRFFRDIKKSRAQATFLLTMFLVILVVEMAGASIYYAERGAEGANIGSASDAIWWGLVTITTVGYGDRFPVTFAGRIIGIFLLFAGIGLFSVLTGFIANIFLAPSDDDEASANAPTTSDTTSPVTDPQAAVIAVRSLLVEQEERITAIRRQLDELERSIATPADPPSPAAG